jgi:hypothetical protein
VANFGAFNALAGPALTALLNFYHLPAAHAIHTRRDRLWRFLTAP